jgi:hypothetical protein
MVCSPWSLQHFEQRGIWKAQLISIGYLFLFKGQLLLPSCLSYFSKIQPLNYIIINITPYSLPRCLHKKLSPLFHKSGMDFKIEHIDTAAGLQPGMCVQLWAETLISDYWVFPF